MALPIFCEYPPMSIKLCHFIALKFEPHHLPSEWCRFTSCLWNLNDVNFLQNDDRLYIRNWCCIISPLWACSCNVKILGGMFWHLQSLHSILWRLQSIGIIFTAPSRFLLAFPCIFKVLIGTPCIFKVLLAFLKSWCLATVQCTLDVWAMLPLKNWCNFNASASVNVECCRGFMNVGMASVSVDVASWQRWMLAQLWCKWNVDMASWQRWTLA